LEIAPTTSGARAALTSDHHASSHTSSPRRMVLDSSGLPYLHEAAHGHVLLEHDTWPVDHVQLSDPNFRPDGAYHRHPQLHVHDTCRLSPHRIRRAYAAGNVVRPLARAQRAQATACVGLCLFAMLLCRRRAGDTAVS